MLKLVFYFFFFGFVYFLLGYYFPQMMAKGVEWMTAYWESALQQIMNQVSSSDLPHP